MKRRDFILKTSKAVGLGFLAAPFISKEAHGKTVRATPLKPEPFSWNNNHISIAWIGHSSFLINIFGTKILTDPVLSTRIGIYFLGTNLGPTRFVEPSLKFNEIPKPDLILLSHAHLDHMDFSTLKSFADKYPGQIDVITAYKTKDVIEGLEWKSLTETDWDDRFTYKDINFRVHKSKHFGWRYPWERDRSKGHTDGRSYNSYILEKHGKKILFSCDINYTDIYRPLAKENIDIIMMPIGAYNPWKHTHCNPEEAYTMAKEINAKYFIPMHTRTFPQGREPYDEAIEWLKKVEEPDGPKVGLYEIGGTFVLNA